MKSPMQDTLELVDDPEGICGWACGMAKERGMHPKEALIEVLSLLRVTIQSKMMANVQIVTRTGRLKKNALTAMMRGVMQNESMEKKIAYLDNMIERVRQDIEREQRHEA